MKEKKYWYGTSPISFLFHFTFIPFLFFPSPCRRRPPLPFPFLSSPIAFSSHFPLFSTLPTPPQNPARGSGKLSEQGPGWKHVLLLSCPEDMFGGYSIVQFGCTKMFHWKRMCLYLTIRTDQSFIVMRLSLGALLILMLGILSHS